MRARHFTILGISLMALTACGGGEPVAAPPATPPPASTPAQAKAPAKAPVVEEEPAPVFSVQEGFRYDPRGRRDPFTNPVPPPPPTPAAAEAAVPVIRPDGLPGVLVAEAKIAGIISSREPGMTKAIINAPGKRTFFASRGDTLFDGVIKEIRPDGVVFTMISPTTKRPLEGERIVKTGTSAGTTAGEKK